jgi:ElaB/YqjD/DUF883 family membrane-anchored ribosome-binding protein
MANSIRNQGETYATEAKEKTASGIDKAKEMATNLGEKASDVASNVAQGARRIGENLGEKAHDAMGAVQSGIKHAGDTIRDYVPSSSRMNEALQSTGQYIEKGFEHASEDFIGMVRRNPVPALLCAAAVGFLLARATRS